MVGEKTKRLQKLVESGFPVPEFVTIATEDVEKSSDELVKMILSELSGDVFAVRSSALVEDAAQSSMAGRFLTKLAVPRDELASAIETVRDDARHELGRLKDFSIIVQEFIEADYSGIAFTRNPIGDREMVIEYHTGRGDAVVGGEVKPIREVFYRSQLDIISQLPDIKAAREQFLQIEKLFDFPQDIEWCIKNGQWFILQSRPITSLSAGIVEKLDNLEQHLPNGKYFFAKTEACDVAPRPSAKTFEILKAMYTDGGPVQRAYKRQGVEYHWTDFLKLFDGELFIDKEKEIQSLFPSHSYFFGTAYAVRPVRLKGFLTSLKNTKRLQSLGGDIDKLFTELVERMTEPWSKVSEKLARQAFLDDYEFIFTINLLAQQALDQLRRVLPADILLVEALSYFPKDLLKVLTPPAGLLGNTFELNDVSTFITSVRDEISKNIPDEIPLNELKNAQNYLRLREYGRWLALRHINRLREFVKVETISQPAWSLPAMITDIPRRADDRAPVGVSAGRATGKLVITPEKGGILIVSALTPELAQHAGELKGVIADHGGLLSHFAIIARELGLPVIVNYPIHHLKLGEQVTMDGSHGVVTTVKPA